MHALQRAAVIATELTYLVDLHGNVLGMNAAAADHCAETSLKLAHPPDFLRAPSMGEALARIAAGEDEVAFRFIPQGAEGPPVHVRVQRLQGAAAVLGLVTVAADVHTSF